MDDPVEIQPFLCADVYSPSLPEDETHNASNANNYKLAFGCTKQTQAWFDVKVFYVRISSCLLDEAPDSLLIVYPDRDINTELEVNGGRISPSERACLTLRRDRIDPESAEATYVSTNNLRTTGDLSFDIFHKDELLLQGSLSRADFCVDDHLLEGYSSVGTSPKSNEAGWSMDCSCGITSPACPFLKGRMHFSTVNPTMEVYVAGRSSGLPIVLTQTVQLIVKKRSFRCSTLDAIPEEEESLSNQVVAGQIADDRAYSKIGNERLPLGLSNTLYMPDGYAEGEEGELSWFNAGVRVGVGLGLGMCLGIGIGVGLLMRTYHATTVPFRRRLF